MWEAFLSSDFFGQSIVIILGIGSVISWSLMAYKLWDLSQIRQGARSFISRFRQASLAPLDIQVPRHGPLNPAGELYRSGVAELRHQVEISPGNDHLTRRGLDRIEETMVHKIEESEENLKSWIFVLGTMAGVGPMLGILGTVYGVLIAFMGMGESRGATIDAVAPGIAGALTTTVAGLLVAIPALIGYNVINKHIERFVGELYRFASEIAQSAEDAFPLSENKQGGEEEA